MKVATCTLCEAACGILVDESLIGRIAGIARDARGEARPTAVRGDPDDPMSRGYVCPKVVGMQDLHRARRVRPRRSRPRVAIGFAR